MRMSVVVEFLVLGSPPRLKEDEVGFLVDYIFVPYPIGRQYRDRWSRTRIAEAQLFVLGHELTLKHTVPRRGCEWAKRICMLFCVLQDAQKRILSPSRERGELLWYLHNKDNILKYLFQHHWVLYVIGFENCFILRYSKTKIVGRYFYCFDSSSAFPDFRQPPV